jgi:DNA-binding NarL/FixJ family response regulator
MLCTVRILLADDDPGMRVAMRSLLEADNRFRVVAAVGDADAAASAAAMHLPHVAVVDVRMPGGGGRAVSAIRECSPDTAIVVCTSYDDAHTRRAMYDAGADAFVVKGADDLLDAVQELMRFRA